MSENTLGVALRSMGSGPVEVMTRVTDFTLKTIGQGAAVGQELVAFRAISFEEVSGGSDVWSFALIEEDDQGARRRLNVYLRGADLLMLRRQTSE